MSMKCKICSYSKRLEIDREIIEGKSAPYIAKKHNVPLASVYYHKNNHISRQLEKSLSLKMQDNNFDLLNRIDNLILNAEIIFKRNFAAEKDIVALKALDTQRATFDLLAKISFSYHQAKILELELLRETREEKENYNNEKSATEFVDSLQILTPEEMTVWETLFHKINSQDKNIKALPDICYKKSVKKSVRTKTEVNETEAKENLLNEFSFQVQPIENHRTIPS